MKIKTDVFYNLGYDANYFRLNIDEKFFIFPIEIDDNHILLINGLADWLTNIFNKIEMDNDNAIQHQPR